MRRLSHEVGEALSPSARSAEGGRTVLRPRKLETGTLWVPVSNARRSNYQPVDRRGIGFIVGNNDAQPPQKLPSMQLQQGMNPGFCCPYQSIWKDILLLRYLAAVS